MGVASVPEPVGRASRVTPTGFHTPVADELPDVVERLVSKLCPERIILFGS